MEYNFELVYFYDCYENNDIVKYYGKVWEVDLL
jgi:hypothetical protein